MSIWKKDISLATLNASSENTIIEVLGIEYTKIGDDFLQASMPVDNRTRQPFGVLHGGASVVLAETLGSVAGNLALADDKMCVGLEINASHLRSMHKGTVIGTAKVVRLGRTMQVWQIDICNDKQQLICSSRLTLSVINRPAKIRKPAL
ncbi:phenylacetic acid degradation-like protein [Psychromonas sp. CNPT3]|uniref:hotdog fold thioesterase n=1 Tax=Psychromonas sp. CNPT3 TaxID=314282 RepID=UPI00006E766F|nr:hotdog fold thioesterase [Psychromonas sp. CNPT3]AGH81683.1 phenylacetic acid degradation-like protein [Psychromonas sp. CNPT3]